MKIVNILLVIVFSLFFCGSSVSAPADSPSMGIDASSALMKALKSPQAEMLSGANGEEGGVYIIFVQSRDGVSMVRNVEALDTLYLLTAQGLDQTLVFETDKTNKGLYLLRYRLVNDTWGDTAIYNPADLPDIDFQKAHRMVKEYSGQHKKIASIAVLINLVPEEPLIVSFQIEGDTAESCEQWRYNVAEDEVYPEPTAGETRCFFDMDE